MKNRSIAFYVIAGLIVIGIISSIRFWIVPVLVFGVIFFLYKFPPNTWSGRFGRSSNARGTKRGKTRNAKFRVIPGSKDSEDPPKYH